MWGKMERFPGAKCGKYTVEKVKFCVGKKVGCVLALMPKKETFFIYENISHLLDMPKAPPLPHIKHIIAFCVINRDK